MNFSMIINSKIKKIMKITTKRTNISTISKNKNNQTFNSNNKKLI